MITAMNILSALLRSGTSEARRRRAWRRLREQRLSLEAAPPAWAESLEARRVIYEQVREAEQRARLALDQQVAHESAPAP